MKQWSFFIVFGVSVCVCVLVLWACVLGVQKSCCAQLEENNLFLILSTTLICMLSFIPTFWLAVLVSWKPTVSDAVPVDRHYLSFDCAWTLIEYLNNVFFPAMCESCDLESTTLSSPVPQNIFTPNKNLEFLFGSCLICMLFYSVFCSLQSPK